MQGVRKIVVQQVEDGECDSCILNFSAITFQVAYILSLSKCSLQILYTHIMQNKINNLEIYITPI